MKILELQKIPIYTYRLLEIPRIPKNSYRFMKTITSSERLYDIPREA
jgi:hypothetical protein